METLSPSIEGNMKNKFEAVPIDLTEPKQPGQRYKEATRRGTSIHFVAPTLYQSELVMHAPAPMFRRRLLCRTHYRGRESSILPWPITNV
jgi:hypothetical protein